jgi:acetophenone carboxylase
MVHGSNLAQLGAAGNEDLPRNLGEVYSAKNPETGDRQLHDIAMSVEPFRNGDTFYVPVGGGAGYGDVLEREPQAVIKDLRNGMTTHHAAQNIYHVVYDKKTLRLDLEATAAERKRVRSERLMSAKPYTEFVEQWQKQRPPQDALAFYGNYPDPDVAEEHAVPAAVNL